MSIETPSITAALGAAPVDEIEEVHWSKTVVTILATTLAVLVVSSVTVLMTLA